MKLWTRAPILRDNCESEFPLKYLDNFQHFQYISRFSTSSSCSFSLAVLEDRQRMYLMAKNTDGTFLKLGLLNVNLVGSVYDLRQDILGVLSTDFKDKKFVMMKETLKDIDGSLEKKLSVSEVYCSDCVLVRFVQDKGK